MSDKTSRLLQFKRYWPTLVMVLLMVLTGYDIYDRHAGASYLIPWWSYGLALLLIGAAVGAAVRKRDATPSPISKLIINSALYGAGDAADLTITDKLNRLTKEGLVVPVNNNLVDYDPAPNKFKRLKIKYQYDAGEPHTAIVPEHGWLMLPEDPQLLKLKSDVEVLQKRIESAATQTAQLELSPLQTEILQLAKDLRGFLSEMGEKPDAIREDYPDTRDGIAEYLEASFRIPEPWLLKFRSLFRLRFAERLERIVYQLGAKGIQLRRLNSSVTGGVRDGDEARQLVEFLISASHQLDGVYVFPRTVYPDNVLEMMPENEIARRIAEEPGFSETYEQYQLKRASKGKKS